MRRQSHISNRRYNSIDRQLLLDDRPRARRLYGHDAESVLARFKTHLVRQIRDQRSQSCCQAYARARTRQEQSPNIDIPRGHLHQ